jgi:hypothetical protein
MVQRAQGGWNVQSNLRNFVPHTGAADKGMIALLKAAPTALEKEWVT